MAAWPVMLNVTGRRIVVVGGGGVALRRVRTLREAGADHITLIAPDVCEELHAMGIDIRKRPWRTGDCFGAYLVVIATDNLAINEEVAREAGAAGALVNRTDSPEAGDLTVMAHRRRGPITIAAATDGASAAAARQIVESLAAGVDEHWTTLLEVAGEFRALARQRITDVRARQSVLRQLTDEHAMDVMKKSGEAGLRQHLQQVMDNTDA